MMHQLFTLEFGAGKGGHIFQRDENLVDGRPKLSCNAQSDFHQFKGAVLNNLSFE